MALAILNVNIATRREVFCPVVFIFTRFLSIKNAEKHGTKVQIKALWAKWNKREAEFDKNHKIQLARVLKEQTAEKETERLKAERTSLKVKR